MLVASPGESSHALGLSWVWELRSPIRPLHPAAERKNKAVPQRLCSLPRRRLSAQSSLPCQQNQIQSLGRRGGPCTPLQPCSGARSSLPSRSSPGFSLHTSHNMALTTAHASPSVTLGLGFFSGYQPPISGTVVSTPPHSLFLPSVGDTPGDLKELREAGRHRETPSGIAFLSGHRQGAAPVFPPSHAPIPPRPAGSCSVSGWLAQTPAHPVI